MTNANASFELSVTRYIAASPERVWEMMTKRAEEWWCPKPWRTEIIEQDWRAGGRSAIMMRGPNGEEEQVEGVFLEVVPNRRMVFSDAFKADWVPQKGLMVGGLELVPEGEGTRYTAWARHWDEDSMKQHEQMGFAEGCAIVADQLAALAEAKASA